MFVGDFFVGMGVVIDCGGLLFTRSHNTIPSHFLTDVLARIGNYAQPVVEKTDKFTFVEVVARTFRFQHKLEPFGVYCPSFESSVAMKKPSWCNYLPYIFPIC